MTFCWVDFVRTGFSLSFSHRKILRWGVGGGGNMRRLEKVQNPLVESSWCCFWIRRRDKYNFRVRSSPEGPRMIEADVERGLVVWKYFLTVLRFQEVGARWPG